MKPVRPKVMSPGNTEQFRNIHKGKKCFICGAGTSLYRQDLSGIHQYPVISVNSSAILMPWLDPGDPLDRFWISTDVLCIQWDYFWNKVALFECTIMVRNSWSRNAKKFKNINMNYYSPRASSKPPKWKHDGIMGGSSIQSALDFALLMGFKTICLLGVDHRMANGHSHFWQNWPVKDRPRREGKPGNFMPCQGQQSRVFTSNLRAFKILDTYAKDLGVTIYNCSSISKVDCFKKISLEDALNL